MKRYLLGFLALILMTLPGQMASATDYQAINATLSGGAVIDGNYVKITSSGGKITFTGLPSNMTTITVYYHTSSSAEANLSFNGQYNATVSNSITSATKVDPKGSYAKTTYFVSVNTITNGQTIWIEKISDGVTGEDTIAPTVSLTTPVPGATLSGTATISAAASDNVGVTKVDFYYGTTLIVSDTTSPYSTTWNTAGVTNGTYSLTAKAYDAGDNVGTSAAVSVSVNNTTTDTIAPAVSISSPAAGVTLSGTATINATASDNMGVTKVDFYYGTMLIASDTTSPYSITWNTAGVANGSYNLLAKAYDAANNVGTSATVNVTVSNTTASGLTVHFKRPPAWGTSVRIHYWNMVPSTVPISGAWPGILMTSEGNDWYVYSVTGATGMSIVFNDGSGHQTADLSRSNTEGWYYTDNKWYDANPEAPKVPVITASPAAGTYLTTQAVTLTGSNSGDIIYYTTNGTTPTTASNVYSAPINVAVSSTIKAFGVNVNGQAGSVSSFDYIIDPNADLTAPTISASSAAGRYDSATLVTFTINDNKPATTMAYYTTDGSTPTTTSTVYVYGNASAGLSGVSLNITQNTTLKFLVIDGAGNRTNASFTYYIGELARNDFREESIYFVITSRFYDGDPGNNVHCWDDASAGNPDSDPAWRGDFKGLIQKLDYIKALGFSAIWITPVVKNCSGYDYHGYHAINFKQVDPRYVSSDTSYQDLINAAHAKGLKIIQDIVINHTGNFGEENLFPMFTKDPAKPDLPANLLKITDKLPANYDTMLPADQYQARLALMKTDTTNNNIYHTEKSLSWESYTVQTGQIAGDCVDLNTEEPRVAHYLVDAYNQYIDMGVDAFRIDTVKHVNRYDFNKYFIPAWTQRGGENFYIFGETCARYRSVWNSGIPSISPCFYTWKESKAYPGDNVDDYLSNKASVEQNWADNFTTTGQPELNNHYLNGNSYHIPDWTKRSYLDQIDFPMHWAFKTAAEAFAMNYGDKYYNDATWNVVYVDSHDYAPDGAPENQRFAGSQDTWAENLSLMFTFRGIPCILYGTEIEFQKGQAIDVGPNAPLSTTGRAYFGNNIEGNVTVSGYGNYSGATGTMASALNYPLAQHIRRLNLIRRAIPALQKGQYSIDNITGSIAFKRRFTDPAEGVDSFALVTISGNAVFTDIPNGTYVDAVTGNTQVVTDGTLTATCSGKGNIRVYVLNGPGKIGEDDTYIK